MSKLSKNDKKAELIDSISETDFLKMQNKLLKKQKVSAVASMVCMSLMVLGTFGLMFASGMVANVIIAFSFVLTTLLAISAGANRYFEQTIKANFEIRKQNKYKHIQEELVSQALNQNAQNNLKTHQTTLQKMINKNKQDVGRSNSKGVEEESLCEEYVNDFEI